MGIVESVRTCYQHGIAKEENKMYEIHGLCDCNWCAHKYLGRTRRNVITAYTRDKSEIEELKGMISKWSCADKTKDLPTFYYNDVTE